MGASGVGLFQDDVAADVRSGYLELLAGGASDAKAFSATIVEWKESIADSDDGPIFWLALAATQWEYGRLHPRAKLQALKVIKQGKGLDRWGDGGLAGKRRAVLARLGKKLLSPQPARKTPRIRVVPAPPSVSVASPDETARAAVWLVGTELGKPLSQVGVFFKDGRSEGGGSVFIARCAQTDIRLKWSDADTLRITHPKDAEVVQRHVKSGYRGRMIAVRYRRV